MLRITHVVFAVVIASLSACGGGGGSDEGGTTGESPATEPVAQATKVGGFWSGQLTVDGETGSETVNGVISERGDGVLRILPFNGTAPSGFSALRLENTTGVDGNISMSLTAYWGDPTGADVTLEGLVVERDSLNGAWSTESGLSGNISLTFNSGYNVPSSMSTLAGIYSEDNIGTMVIESDGTLFMQDVDGCTYSGTAGEVDTDYNLYDVAFEIGNCSDLNSQVTGFLEHHVNGNNELIQFNAISDLGFVYSRSFSQYN